MIGRVFRIGDHLYAMIEGKVVCVGTVQSHPHL